MAGEEENHVLKGPSVGHAGTGDQPGQRVRPESLVSGGTTEDDLGSVLLDTHSQLDTHMGSAVLWAWQILRF